MSCSFENVADGCMTFRYRDAWARLLLLSALALALPNCIYILPETCRPIKLPSIVQWVYLPCRQVAESLIVLIFYAHIMMSSDCGALTRVLVHCTTSLIARLAKDLRNLTTAPQEGISGGTRGQRVASDPRCLQSVMYPRPGGTYLLQASQCYVRGRTLSMWCPAWSRARQTRLKELSLWLKSRGHRQLQPDLCLAGVQILSLSLKIRANISLKNTN